MVDLEKNESKTVKSVHKIILSHLANKKFKRLNGEYAILLIYKPKLNNNKGCYMSRMANFELTNTLLATQNPGLISNLPKTGPFASKPKVTSKKWNKTILLFF
ncbi:hypothetical protein MHBO_000539 [Bonamia ostreae]|uniref:Uncharacterized protein n=1 Tax=Bonamia ostreae TaxID=126728 RepID=A0ABV2AH60_9EUKA